MPLAAFVGICDGRGRLCCGDCNCGICLGAATDLRACGMREGRNVGEVASPPPAVGDVAMLLLLMLVVIVVDSTI